jgi:tight adherence protein C
MIFPLLIALSAALCVALFVWGVALRTADRPVPDGMVIASRKPVRKGFGPLLLKSLSPAARFKLRRRIERAGRPGGLTVEGYAQSKAGNIVLYGSAGLIGLLLGHAIIAVGLLALGLFQTDIVLWNLSRERQTAIQRGLPDFLDVLAVTVTAGLSFRHALERVAEAMPGPVADEMITTLRQMDLGRSLREAFQELRQRNDSESLAAFVTAILQAEELGAPLAHVLTEIGLDMRREAAQQARRRAQRIDPQVTMITTFMMVPGMVLLIVGMLWFGTGGSAITHVIH